MSERPDPEQEKEEERRSSLVPRWLAALVLILLLGAAGWTSWLVLTDRLRGPS